MLPVEHLDLKALIRPKDSFLEVKGTFVVSNVTDSLPLLLNPCLELVTIEITGEDGWEGIEFTEKRPPEDIFMPVASYGVSIPESHSEKDEITLRTEYRGRLYRYLFDTTRIREDFVELAIYAPWYPMTSFSDRPSYRLELNGPDDWTWVANAPLASEKPLIWEAKTTRTDITLHGRPSENSISAEDSDLFWGDPRYLESLLPLEDDFKPFMELIKEWLGSTDNDNLKIVLVPRDFGGGYSRSGLVVLQDDIGVDMTDSKRKTILKYWAHEYAHFWWKKTTVDDYHNWLDEALAEYTARLACEEVIGEAYFEELIENLRNTIREEEDLPPIKEIKRQHPKAQTVFYVYGALVFHEIRKRIGKDQFIEFLSAFAQKEVSSTRVTTDDLIEVLEQTTGLDWQGHIEDRITMEPAAL